MTRSTVLGAALAVLVASTSLSTQSPISLLTTPAGPDSGMYSLATGGNGTVYLSWIDTVAAGGHALRFSTLANGKWTSPTTVAQGSNWFVNWADHPSVTAAKDGRLYAHWLVTTGRKTGSYGYAIRVATSTNLGKTWTTAFEEGTRNISDYSGFLTFLPTASGMNAVYLTPLTPDDGTGHEHDHVKTVGIVRFGANGRELGREIVDSDSCSCCNTDIAETSNGLVAVYRDHTPGEIRDISIVRRVNGRWTSPVGVHRDGWEINGCPTNGPAVAARGNDVVVAWYTGARNQPRLHVAFSRDAGATFGAPVRVDDGAPVGWADVAHLADGRVVVSWLERAADGNGSVRLREVTPKGRSVAVSIAATASGRTAGIPMMTASGNDAIVAWRNGRVQTARVSVPRASVR